MLGAWLSSFAFKKKNFPLIESLGFSENIHDYILWETESTYTKKTSNRLHKNAANEITKLLQNIILLGIPLGCEQCPIKAGTKPQ